MGVHRSTTLSTGGRFVVGNHFQRKLLRSLARLFTPLYSPNPRQSIRLARSDKDTPQSCPDSGRKMAANPIGPCLAVGWRGVGRKQWWAKRSKRWPKSVLPFLRSGQLNRDQPDALPRCRPTKQLHQENQQNNKSKGRQMTREVEEEDDQRRCPLSLFSTTVCESIPVGRHTVNGLVLSQRSRTKRAVLDSTVTGAAGATLGQVINARVSILVLHRPC